MVVNGSEEKVRVHMNVVPRIQQLHVLGANWSGAVTNMAAVLCFGTLIWLP